MDVNVPPCNRSAIMLYFQNQYENRQTQHQGCLFFGVLVEWLSVIIVNRVMFECSSAGAYSSLFSQRIMIKKNNKKTRKIHSVVFQYESSVLLVHGPLAMIHSKNSILLLRHCLSVMGPGILNTAKLKLSITLIKSTARRNTHSQTYTWAHTDKTRQMSLLCQADVFVLT